MIRFILKVISLPLIAVTALAGAIMNLLANLSAYVAGPVLLFIMICDIYSLVMRSWQDVFLLTLIGGGLFGLYLCAGIVIGLLEGARDGLVGFLHS